jgi:hypothetical protein
VIHNLGKPQNRWCKYQKNKNWKPARIPQISPQIGKSSAPPSPPLHMDSAGSFKSLSSYAMLFCDYFFPENWLFTHICLALLNSKQACDALSEELCNRCKRWASPVLMWSLSCSLWSVPSYITYNKGKTRRGWPAEPPPTPKLVGRVRENDHIR